MKISLKAYLGFFAVMAVSFIMLSGHKVSAAPTGNFTNCTFSSPLDPYTTIKGSVSIKGLLGSAASNYFEVWQVVAPNQPNIKLTQQNIGLTLVASLGPDGLAYTFEEIVLAKLTKGSTYFLRGQVSEPSTFSAANIGYVNTDPAAPDFFSYTAPDVIIVNQDCLGPASALPVGGIDSCELNGDITVIKGWAWDPDVPNVNPLSSDSKNNPIVQISVTAVPDATSYSRSLSAVTTDGANYRTADINNFLNSSSLKVPIGSISSYHGFTAEFTSLVRGKVYTVDVYAQNFGGGPPTKLPYNDSVFTGYHILPQTCLPVPTAKPSTINKPKQCINGIGCDNVEFSKDPVVKKPVNVPTVALTGGAGDTSVGRLLSVLLGLAGGIALLVIVVAGFRFVTSQGNPDATNRARNTIIYALIGLVVCTLAYSVVTFVLERIV